MELIKIATADICPRSLFAGFCLLPRTQQLVGLSRTGILTNKETEAQRVLGAPPLDAIHSAEPMQALPRGQAHLPQGGALGPLWLQDCPAERPSCAKMAGAGARRNSSFPDPLDKQPPWPGVTDSKGQWRHV